MSESDTSDQIGKMELIVEENGGEDPVVGCDPNHIDLVLSQIGQPNIPAQRKLVARKLKEHKGDIVNTIMDMMQ